MKKLFFDLETTGTDYRKHSVHQIAGIIEIDGIVEQSFDIRSRPHPRAFIEHEALRIAGVTLEEVSAYQDMKSALREFKTILANYVNPYDRKDKFHVIGYNNRFFDDVFIRAWFEQCGDNFIGSWFWPDTIDTLVLASQYLTERRANMPSFKLSRVAMELGIVVDKDECHNASYDVQLTRKVYRIVTGIDLEI